MATRCCRGTDREGYTVVDPTDVTAVLLRIHAQIDTQTPSELTEVDIDATTLFGAVTVLATAYLLARLSTYALTRLSEKTPKYRINVKVIIPVLRVLIYAFGIYLVLVPLFDVSSTQVLAFSGVLGAVLGFGLKDLFANLISGLFMIFERPYQIGDKIEVDDHYGEITNIGMRSTKVRTPDDDKVSIPNYLSFTESVANANAGSKHMLVPVELFVAPGADLDRAREIVEQAVVSSGYVYVSQDHPFEVLIEDGPYYHKVRAKAYVDDLRNELRFRSDVTDRSLGAFADEGIPTPETSIRTEHN